MPPYSSGGTASHRIHFHKSALMAKSSIHLKLGITYLSYKPSPVMGHFQPVVGVPNLELRPLERFFYLVQEGSLALISVSGTCPEETAGVRFSGIESGLSCART
ncbi:hypothetical protein VNO77_50917 [Canavalia gladiata]|uniref:Uncharacterized protein n=1 Tax=Canavalia gladiata TaxID=3824 RepID=A0AAN9JD36_CANGL